MLEGVIRSTDSFPSQWAVARLARILRQNLPLLRKEFGVASFALFGSYARNEQRPDSDLDVLVEFEKPTDLFEFVALRDRLTNRLGVEVDLVMRTALRPPVDRYILDEAAVV